MQLNFRYWYIYSYGFNNLSPWKTNQVFKRLFFYTTEQTDRLRWHSTDDNIFPPLIWEVTLYICIDIAKSVFLDSHCLMEFDCL